MLRKLMALVCALAIAAVMVGVVTVIPEDAVASHSTRYGHGFAPPDSNGYVPEYYGVVGTCYDGIVGRDHYYLDRGAWYGPHVHWIEYDSCEMKRLGATSAGWARLQAHEWAHSRGFSHGEGSPSHNAAYRTSVSLY